jgi:DNA-binding transcriptional ArsR family regulator
MSVMPGRTCPADAYEAIFTALAHPARRRILISLNFADGELSAGQIAGLFTHAWPTTTRHLQALEGAGIIRHERRGRARIYRLERAPLALVRDWLAWFDRDPVTAEERDNERDRPTDTKAFQAEHRSRSA